MISYALQKNLTWKQLTSTNIWSRATAWQLLILMMLKDFTCWRWIFNFFPIIFLFEVSYSVSCIHSTLQIFYFFFCFFCFFPVLLTLLATSRKPWILLKSARKIRRMPLLCLQQCYGWEILASQWLTMKTM